ncbi:MAG: phosphoglucosamine mutase, partial [Angustibacter sp.]
MARLFGTDGVRGLANRDITPELALGLAAAAATVLSESGEFLDHRPLAVVGRDPRASGEFLSAAVIAGLAASGLDVLDVGVLPTPAVAYLTAVRNADLGVMLSASHNAMPDNGIKFFARGGHKLPDEVEDLIEQRLSAPDETSRIRPTGASVGRVRSSAEAADEYIAHLLAAVPQSLSGVRVVLDCAHGAASDVAPRLFHAAGADVCAIGAAPTGLNINDGYGSTHLAALQEAVVRIGADFGLALDGDADRCLAVDSRGAIVDGDQIMAILAISLRDRGLLRKNTLVATVMSNLGLLLAMAREGIEIETTAVGDRYVLERMRADGFSLGGEQSGHVIFADHG